MAWLRGKSSIRLQLIGLFSLLIAAGAGVLGLDELERHKHQQMLEALDEETLVSLRRIQAVSDGYGLDITSTVFRVRNYLVSWENGLVAVDAAKHRTDDEWVELQASLHTPEERTLLTDIGTARLRADRAVEQLRAILRSRDIKALGHFADTELFPAMDPVTSKFQRLEALVLERGRAQVREENQRALIVGEGRIGLSLLALLVSVWIASLVLRNIYRGVESLLALTAQMRRHDYTAQPRYRPEGDLGVVLDSFLALREEVRKSEAEQAALLARNEQVRATLARSEEFNRSLFTAAQVAVMSVDLEGRFSSFNPYAEQLSGYAAAEMIGQRNVGKLLLADEARDVAERLGAALGRTVHPDARMIPLLLELGAQAQEWTLVRKDGVRVPVLLATSAMRDEAGAPIGHLAIATDLTRMKQLEDALRASEIAARDASKTKSDFLAAMSHEIRTPMIGVTGMLEVLSHGHLDPDQRRTVSIIQQSAQSLLDIIGDILDFSKVEAGRLELSTTTISLQQLLRATLANFSGAASSKRLVLHCEIDPRVGPAHVADPLRLRQILSNFLSNALKFTDDGFVHAALEWRGAGTDSEQLCFRVTDTGIGVSAEQQARLFQPFSQAEGSTTRRYGGTGLGLVICRRLAELMGGQVTMESTAGAGTTMRLLLALTKGDPADIEQVADAASPSPEQFRPRALPDARRAEAERSLILLVDDHPTNRLVVARQLALAGYASESAEDGLDGLERWRSGRYALVLSDVHMPRMDGYQMTQAIREEEAHDHRPRTPVVALTAAALKGEAERCLAAGMDDYLSKPVTIPQLAACLQRWLPHTKMSAQQVAALHKAAAPSPPLPQTQGEPVPLDAAVLDALTGGDPGQKRALLQDYLTTTAGDLQTARRAREDGDCLHLAREAHKIKGAALLVGAGEVAAAALALEQAAKASDWPQLLPRSADLETAVERLRLHVTHTA